MAVECLVVWLLSSNLDPVDKSQNQDTTALSVSSVATFPPCSDDVQCIVYFIIYFLTGFGDETGGQEQRGRLSRWSTWSRPDGCSSPPPYPTPCRGSEVVPCGTPAVEERGLAKALGTHWSKPQYTHFSKKDISWNQSSLVPFPIRGRGSERCSLFLFLSLFLYLCSCSLLQEVL